MVVAARNSDATGSGGGLRSGVKQEKLPDENIMG